MNLTRRLDETFASVEAPTKLVGYTIPDEAREWAEENGLEVQQSDFAPRGQLFIIGAVPVPWEWET